MNNINVVYTPWANLKKTGDMDVGQIGFHRQKEVSRPALSLFEKFTVMDYPAASSPARPVLRCFTLLTLRLNALDAQVKIVAVEKKINEIVNRLEKTKEERCPDLAAEKESRDREERNEKKAQLQEHKRKEKEEQKRKREMEELR